MNSYAIEEGNTNSKIILNFQFRDKGELIKFRIERSWNLNHNGLKENYLVYRNSQLLGSREIEDFLQYLKRYLPPTLFDFFFFDGERVHQYVLDSKFEENIKEAFMTLFNLDLFENLNSDLHKYLRQENIFKSLTDEQRKYTSLDMEIEAKKQSIRSLENRVSELKNERKNINVMMEELEQEFSAHGGIVAEERQTLTQKIAEYELKKKELSESIKSDAAHIIPLKLVEKLLQKTQNQVSQEEEVEKFNKLQSDISEENIHRMIKSLTPTFSIENENSENPEKELANALSKEFNQSLKPKGMNIDSFKPIHNMNKEQKEALHEWLKKVNQFDGNSVKERFNDISKYINEIYETRKNIEHSIEDQSLKDIMHKINENTKKVEQINYEITGNEEKIRNGKQHLNELTYEIEKISKKVHQAKKDENIFEVTQKINTVLSKYKQNQVEKYLDSVEKYFLQMFNSLMRKGQFLESFKIDPNSFNIKMKNHTGNSIFKHSFSAGETQLFFLTLLWSLLKASGQKIPLVLDTLFARLDKTHKENLINIFLPVASEQVIILSTDTEIDEYYHEMLKPYVKDEYSLIYNRTTNDVSIVNDYIIERGGDYHVISTKNS
ncbi:DNA sulfur modification protein DndD [Salisediminibacterium beveridgei]|uniref:Nuclease SbcCD subunit C n=2 Tax=Salisediminibacterium beveridgei TaxID=632773 RepID=A0A1D7QWZ4_9BACI|nr:DNA sulfur modification protein DndD [Salisediminibacterium beveridgei]